MARPQFTITLGRSGQKVVRRPWDNGSVSNDPPLSGTKRYRAESNAGESLLYTDKRLQVDVIARSSGYRGPGDVRLSGNDLRLKLLRKRMSRRIEEEKKKELLENMSRTTQSSQGPERFLSRNIAPVRRKAPSGNPQVSGGMPSSRPIGEVLKSPMPILASRTRRMVSSDLLDPSRAKGPRPMMVMAPRTRNSLNPSKHLKELPSASSSMLRNTYTDEHLTVSCLLHSLGLGKYAILFQAEEVDMAALKQMGDHDLKELGIPMGPRKKILIAMLARTKRPVAGLPSAV